MPGRGWTWFILTIQDPTPYVENMTAKQADEKVYSRCK
ncbi:hypothetical protein SLEP1_g38752 [Rubroshorea leprosula]|uniref:Uncharacterized protein n=1 Tax=Rubroshorea leprosula TaxID=152421 RepID=A0AAV5KY82_9ROSI|nr:hypothetical protein SLEP1_g38752 [Rubroshorea leprosula]